MNVLPNSGSGKKPTIELSPEQADEMVKVFKHYSEAACPPELLGQPTEPFEHPITKFIPVLFSWTRQTPRYHPVFNTTESRAVDIDFLGYDFRPEAMIDAKILQKSSKFVWHNRLKAPQPALLKAWMVDEVDIDGQPKPGITLDLPEPIFANFFDWDRFQQYIVDQKQAGRDYIELAEDLLAQSKAGWNLPSTVINNCERFLTRIEHMPDIREALAMDYVDFAWVPTEGENTLPAIKLKKLVTRKKISKRQLARLEEIVIYLLPPPLRVGLTRKLSERQLHYLARAAKWLRPASDPIWKKNWADGLDLLALMVMDRKHILEPAFIRQVASYIQDHIDALPDHKTLMDKINSLSQTPKLAEAAKPEKPTAGDTDFGTEMMRRMIYNPDVKHFPGSDQPKNLILTRMGILRPGKVFGIDEDRLEKFETLANEAYQRRNDPEFWVMNQLDMSVMLMNDVIDLDGNIIGEELEVTPFLRMELRHGAERKLWNKIAGLWLYPHAKKPLPDILTKHEAETLQIICYWLSLKEPRRPRPFFWAIQDIIWNQLQGSSSLNTQRMRELAKFIHQHRDDPPDFEVLKLV